MSRDLAGDLTHVIPWGGLVFDAILTLGVVLYWRKLRRRARMIRRLCEHGIATRGFVVSKRIEERNGNKHYLVKYLFTNPHTSEPVQLDAKVEEWMWKTVGAGKAIHVLVEELPGKSVIVYEFCPFKIVAGEYRTQNSNG